MMGYVWHALIVALEIIYGYFFFYVFWDSVRQREEDIWFLVLSWLSVTLCGLLTLQGAQVSMGHLWQQNGIGVVILPGLTLLFFRCLMLLYLFDQNGWRGISALAGATGLSWGISGLCALLQDGIGQQAGLVVGKLVLLALSMLLTYGRKNGAWVSAKGLAAILGLGAQREEHERDLLMLRQHMELQAESIRALEQSYRLQRKSAHEFEHHLQILTQLLAREETEAAKEYLKRLQKHRATHVIAVNSHHPIIDAILNQKYQTATEDGIVMQIRVNDLSQVTLPLEALAVLLTNLLDNAIEACRRVEGNGEIRCLLLWEDGLYLSIRNTSLQVQPIAGFFVSSKPDPIHHGFGLMSVRLVLEELLAEYTCGYEDGWFQFVAEIPGQES